MMFFFSTGDAGAGHGVWSIDKCKTDPWSWSVDGNGVCSKWICDSGRETELMACFIRWIRTGSCELGGKEGRESN